MNQGIRLSKTAEQITDLAIARVRPFHVPAGTVLLSFKLSVGKVGIAERPLYTNEAIAALVPRADVDLDPRYLLRVLQFLDLSTNGNDAVLGVVLNRAALESLRIPLPPVPEQRRIAAILDEADALRAAAARSSSVELELADALFDTAVDHASARTELCQAVDLITGPFGSAIHKSDYTSGGIPLINPSHIVAGRLRPAIEVAVSADAAKGGLASFALRSGDVVLGRRGEMGRSAVVEEDDVPALCGTGTMILRPRVNGAGRFIARLLRTPRYVQELTRVASGVTMLNLSQAAVGSISIPAPSRELIERVDRMEARLAVEIEQSEARRKHLDSLFASLQHRAFRGEL